MSKKLEEARQFHEPLQELLANILTAAEKAKSQSASRHTAYSREIILEARKTAAEDSAIGQAAKWPSSIQMALSRLVLTPDASSLPSIVSTAASPPNKAGK